MTEISSIQGLFGIAKQLELLPTVCDTLLFKKAYAKFFVDLGTKILDDLDDKFVPLTRLGLEHQELLKVVKQIGTIPHS